MMEAVIFGAGGLGQMVLDILRQTDRVKPVAFLDSDNRLHGLEIDGLTVAGGFESAEALRHEGVGRAIVAIGENETRRRIAERLQEAGFELISAIHPLASIALTAEVAPHVIIGARANICVHAQLAADCVVNSGCIVEHDNRIGAGAFLYPAVRLAGGVKVGECAVLGIGACVIPGRTIGSYARVEPGAVVIRDVPHGARVSGAPAVEAAPAHSRFHVNEALPAGALLAGG